MSTKMAIICSALYPKLLQPLLLVNCWFKLFQMLAKQVLLETVKDMHTVEGRLRRPWMSFTASSSSFVRHEMSWNVMKSHEISWNLMKSHEISWNLMKSHEISWNHKSSFESSANPAEHEQVSQGWSQFQQLRRKQFMFLFSLDSLSLKLKTGKSTRRCCPSHDWTHSSEFLSNVVQTPFK